MKYLQRFGETRLDGGYIVPTPGVSVVAFTGDRFKVTAANGLYREKAHKILALRTAHGRLLKVTGIHKLLSLTENGLEWVKAGELRPGSYIGAPREIDYPASNAISPEDAYFLGLYVAEGSYSTGISNSNRRIVRWLENYIRNRFGYEPTALPDRSGWDVFLRSPTETWLGELHGTTAATKYVPQQVLDGSIEIVKAFLAGYIDGDGYISESRGLEITTKSKRLAEELTYLLGRVGVHGSFRGKTVKGETYYRLYINRNWLNLLDDLPVKAKRITCNPLLDMRIMPSQLAVYLRNVYRETVGGGRGCRKKRFGKDHDWKVSRQILTRNRFSHKVRISYKVFEEIYNLFNSELSILNRIREELKEFSDRDFRSIDRLIPFPLTTICRKLGLARTTLNNYRWRGLPKDDAKRKAIQMSLMKEVNCRHQKLLAAVQMMQLVEKFQWDLIESVQEIQYNDYVYDFYVPEGNTFIGGNMPTLLHNSIMCHQLAVDVQLPVERGGLNGGALYIDTEQSLPYDEPILVSKSTGYDLMPIGELVEQSLKNAKKVEVLNGTSMTSENPFDYYAVSFDPKDLKIRTFKITGFFKHPPKKTFRVTLSSGRSVRVTEHHNFFRLDEKGGLSPVSTSSLRPGNMIAVAGAIPQSATPYSLNLAKLLKAGSRQDDFIVYGGKKFEGWIQAQRLTITEVVSNLGYAKNSIYNFKPNWADRRLLPLSVFKILIDKVGSEVLEELRISGRGKRNALPVILGLSDEFLRILGLYVAEGCTAKGNHNVIITTTSEKIRRLVESFGRAYNLTVRRSKRDLIITSKVLYQLLPSLVGSGAHNKHVPSFVFDLDKSLVKSFLEGYMLGDGTVRPNRSEGYTTSRRLANDLLYLFLKLGIAARVYLSRKASFGDKRKRSLIYAVHWSPAPTKETQLRMLPNTNCEVGLLLRNVRQELGVSHVAYGPHWNYALHVETGNPVKHVSRRELSILMEPLKKYGRTETLNILERLLDSDVWFDSVVAVNENKVEPVYDIEVRPDNEEIENFVGGFGGIILHNTFRPEWVVRMAEHLNLDPDETAKNIIYCEAYNSDHQMLLLDKADKVIKDNNIRLIVIDSLTAHFRSEYLGREMLAERQQKLNSHMHRLVRLARAFNAAAVVTNQVMAKPDQFFAMAVEAVGGHVVAHTCLHPDTLVQMADGALVKIKNVHNPMSVKAIDLSGDLKMKEGRCSDVFTTRLDYIYDVKTENYQIKASPNHRFFKLEGLKVKETMARDLRAGDYVASVRKIDVKGSLQPLPHLRIKRFFRLSEEGRRAIKQKAKSVDIEREDLASKLRLSPRHLRKILNQGYPIGEDKLDIVAEILGLPAEKLRREAELHHSLKCRDIKASRYLTESLSQVIGYMLGDGHCYSRCVRIREERLDVLRRYRALFKEVFGISGRIRKVSKKHCYELNVNSLDIAVFLKQLLSSPLDLISRSTESCVASFIKGFADAEGSVSDWVYISQKDKALLEAVQMLLLRLGITSGIERGTNCYTLRIAEGASVRKFRDNIGFSSFEKTRKLNDIINDHKCAEGSDLIPVRPETLWNLIREFGTPPSKLLKHKENACITRRKLREIFQTLSRTRNFKKRPLQVREQVEALEKLADSPLGWQRIRRIQPIKIEEPVYDVTIPEYANFIANGILVHNSHTRVFIRRTASGPVRIARLVSSPYLPEGERIFKITENGIEDITEEDEVKRRR
jgi:intein/homing endonuclease